MALGTRYLNPRANTQHNTCDYWYCASRQQQQACSSDRCRVAMSHNAIAEILGRWVPWCMVVVLASLDLGYAIDCFKCVSQNGNYPACDDPFHNNFTTGILETPCMGGRKGRDGLFPATACIKLAGFYDDTGERITVRGCELDSGTLTTDTEIIRMSHCGGFYYNERYVRGCLQSCNDADACNMTPTLQTPLVLLVLCSIILMVR